MSRKSKIKNYFKDYHSYHRKKGNIICHFLGIPMIAMTLLALLDRVVFYDAMNFYGIHASLGLLLWGIGNLFYLYLHYGLGLTMVISTGGLYLVGVRVPLDITWGVFIAGWVLQFIGHYVYEKKSPAFMTNLIHIFVGPLYIQNYFLKIVK